MFVCFNALKYYDCNYDKRSNAEGGFMSKSTDFDFCAREKLARQWRQKLKDIRTLAEREVYIRMLGLSFRPVSLSPYNPCGKLTKENGQTIGATKSIDRALEIAEEGHSHEAKNGKPEHILQAGLIHYALTHDLELKDRFLGFEKHFDELLFVGDEVRLNKVGSVRADLLALGRKGDVFFPVFLELKVGRHSQELRRQLENAYEATSKTKNSFIRMLSQSTDVPYEKIQFDQYKLLMIWPALASNSRSKADLSVDTKGESCAGHYLMGEFEFLKTKASLLFDVPIKFVAADF